MLSPSNLEENDSEASAMSSSIPISARGLMPVKAAAARAGLSDGH